MPCEDRTNSFRASQNVILKEDFSGSLESLIYYQSKGARYLHILVTGATGRIGSRFVPRLLEQEDSVRVFVLPTESTESLQQMGAEVVRGNLLQRETVAEAVKGVDAVIHLAGLLSGSPDSETHEVNLGGTETLALEAISAGVSRFIFSSTGMIYGPGRNRPFRESDPPNPPNKSYPLSKAAAEARLRELPRFIGTRTLNPAFSFCLWRRRPPSDRFLARSKFLESRKAYTHDSSGRRWSGFSRGTPHQRD